AIVEKAVTRLEAKREVHEQRDAEESAGAVDRLAFDASMEGERLRRFQTSGQRSLLRTLDTLLKVRRSGVVSVVPGEGEPPVSTGRNEPAGKLAGSEFGLARTVLERPLSRDR